MLHDAPEYTMGVQKLGSVYARLKKEAGDRLGIDARTLAAFRVSLGVVVLVNLALRTRDLTAFYTDGGVLPPSVVTEQFSGAPRYSLYTLDGSFEFQALLFVLTAVFAVALIVGYRTRLAAVCVFLLVLSLNARNTLLMNSGDKLLTRILFWSVFLPLGERWSLDARRRADERDVRGRIASVATAGLLAQVVVVYAVNGIFKLRSEEWVSGEAVPMVFELTAYTTSFGSLLTRFPEFLVFLNYLWVAMLVTSPLLLVFKRWLRAAFVGLFVAAQVGLLVTMNLAIFPLVSIAGLVALTPPVFWDEVARLRRRLGESPGAEAESDSRAGSVSESQPQRQRSESDFRNLGLDAFLVSVPGLDADDPPSLQRLGRIALSGALAVLLLTVLVMNASAVGYVDTSEVPETVEEIKYKWSLFAPNPVSSDRWYVVRGELESGGEVDPLHRSRSFTFDKRPDPFPNARWRKYLDSVKDWDEDYLDEPLGEYLCERWNEGHDSTLTELELYYVWVGDSGEIHEEKVMAHSCGGTAEA